MSILFISWNCCIVKWHIHLKTKIKPTLYLTNSSDLELALRAVKDLVPDFNTKLDINNTNINLSQLTFILL